MNGKKRASNLDEQCLGLLPRPVSTTTPQQMYFVLFVRAGIVVWKITEEKLIGILSVLVWMMTGSMKFEPLLLSVFDTFDVDDDRGNFGISEGRSRYRMPDGRRHRLTAIWLCRNVVIVLHVMHDLNCAV